MVDALTAPFWAAANEGILMVQRSPSTGRLQWPPRPRMLPDWDEEPEWVEIEGRGSVYSYSVVLRSSHAVPPTPYVMAVVDLGEGVSMLTNLVNVDPQAVRIGLPVKLVFERVNAQINLPVFEPDEPAPAA